MITMKSAIILLAILGTAFAQLSEFDIPEDDPGVIGSRLVRLSKRETNETSCTQAFSCQSCRKAQVCRPGAEGKWTLVKTIGCNGYCDYNSGTCTNTPNNICGDDDEFICMQENDKFPSTNETQYHVCSNYTAKKFECAFEGYSYNPTTQDCVDAFSSATFNCTGSKGLKVKHPSDGQYYAYCDDEETAVVIDKCFTNYHLNETSQNCEPHCTENGVFAHPTDCTSYIKCSTVWYDGTPFLIPTTMSCAANTGFDSSQYVCVSLEELPSCTSKALV